MAKKHIEKKDYSILKYSLFTILIILYWEFLIYINVHGSLKNFTIYNVLFTCAIGIVISSIFGFSKKTRNIEMIVIMLVLSIVYLADLIYFKTFGSLVSYSMIGVGTDAVTNFYWSIIQTIKENIISIILFELPIIYLIIDAIKTKYFVNEYKPIRHLAVIVVGILLWIATVFALPLSGDKDYTPYGVYHSRYTDTDTSSAKLGVLPNLFIEARYAIFGGRQSNMIEIEETTEVVEEVIDEKIEYNRFDSLDFSKLKEKTTDESIINVCDYLNSISATNKNKYTGIFEGYNLIYICAESFSSMAIDPVVTPTLYKMANNGIVLNNYYNGFKNVTTNGEYALLTGLWPDTAREETNMGVLSGTMGQSIEKDMNYALGNVFKNNGIKAYGYHNFLGTYYGRNQTLPNMGFDCKFMNDGMEFTSYWPASDLEMMEQSINDYINEKQFCAYYMTFSGHGNYSLSNYIVSKNYDKVKSLIGDTDLPENSIGYLSGNYELELAMEYLLNQLENAGILDKTAIVLTGDHFPYYLQANDFKAFTGEEINEFNDYKTTCIIYNSSIEKIVNDEPCCNVDILPTILNLFGIEYDSRLYAGNDVFSDGRHVAMLYNKSFISDMCKYDSTTGDVIWLKDTSKFSEQLLEEYVSQMYSYVKNKYAYCIAVEDTDFYRFVDDNK